jgi:hypothetical protein
MAFSVATPFLKPNWLATSNLLVLKFPVSLTYKAFSKTFEKEVSSDIDLQFAGFILSPFLYMGFIIENFIRSGKVPDKIDLFKI